MKRPPTRIGASTRVPSQARASAPSGVSKFEPYFRGFNVLTDPEFENFRDNSGGWYWPERIDDTGESRFTIPYLDTDCPSFLLWPNQTCAENLLVGWCQTSGPFILPDPPDPPDPPPTGDTTAPAVPTWVSAFAGDTQVILDWSDNVETDFASYRLYRATASAGPFTFVVSTTVSDYVNTGLTNGTTYWYRLSAVDTSGNESAQSASFPVAGVTPAAPPGGDVTPPAVPTNLTAVAGDGLVTLNWDNSPSSDFSFFNVKRATVSGGPYTIVQTRTASDWVNTGLVNGTTYYFVVSAVDTSGNQSANSTQASATPTVPTPPPPPPPDPPGGGADGFATYANRVVTINPGDDIDTKINSVSVGSVIGFAAGVHLIDTAGKQFSPRNGEILVGETDVDGVPLAIIRGNWNQTQSGTGITSPFPFPNTESYSSNVQFLRLQVERFACEFQQAAINGGDNWRIHKCYINNNKSVGLRLGNGAIAFECKIFRNMQLGLKNRTASTGAIVDGCEVYENNFNDWNTFGNEAGGMKFIALDPINMIVRNSHYHHNHGAGIWYDDCGVGGIIENNISEFNLGPGIFYEISTGNALIRNNTVSNNGGAAEIYLANSRGLDTNPIIVENNTINSLAQGALNHAAIWIKDDPTRSPRTGYTIIRGNTVKRAINPGRNNVATGLFGNTSTTPPGMVINDNDYFIASGVIWQWIEVSKSWAQWQALGFDTTGSQQPL